MWEVERRGKTAGAVILECDGIQFGLTSDRRDPSQDGNALEGALFANRTDGHRFGIDW